MKIKKTLASIVLAGVSLFGSVGCSQNNQKIGQIKTEPRELQKVTWQQLNAEKRPRYITDINNYLMNIKKEKDTSEEWKSAKRTFEEGEGDCEDIAFLGAYLAEKFFEYPPALLYLGGRKSRIGHVVALLKVEDNGKIRYGAIEKDFIIFPECKTIDEVAQTLNENVGKDKFSVYRVVNLNLSNLDWRTGKENLRPYFNSVFSKR